MATETLHFENARFAQQLFNHEPRNLQALETELGVKATAREGWIKLDGSAEAVERAKQLFASLQNMLQAGSPVKNRKLRHHRFLKSSRHSGCPLDREAWMYESHHGITHRFNGDVVSANILQCFSNIPIIYLGLKNLAEFESH